MQLPAGYRHVGFVTIGSTMDEAARLLKQSADTNGTVVSALEQTGGRGRMERVWVSRPGNLYASMILKPPCSALIWPQLSFVIALAVHGAVRKLLPTKNVQLKWPNDVLVEDKKISGILLEKRSDINGEDALVIGFGINCLSHPTDTLYPSTSLTLEGVDNLEPENLLPDVLKTFDAFYQAWLKHGFAPIRDAWLNVAKGIGQPINVRQQNGQISGIFTDIAAEDGALLVTTAQGELVRVGAGDVYF